MGGLSYEILDRATGAHKGWLTADGTPGGYPVVVGNEPVFAGKLNQGAGQIQIQVDRWPGALGLAFADLIRIRQSDGAVMGRWKYEAHSGDLAQNDTWQVDLFPLAAELNEVDYSGNFTLTPQAFFPALGLTRFDAPVVAAIPRTKHCSLVTHANDGTSYALQYPKQGGVVKQTLDRAVSLGGADWWWYCNGDGAVELAHGGRRTVSLVRANHIAWEKPASGIARVYNVQPVTGGPDTTPGSTGLASGMPLQAVREVGAGPYGTAAIGRRLAPNRMDPIIRDQATLDRFGDAILSRTQAPNDTRTLRLVNAPLLQPGDLVTITDPGGAVGGPWFVTDWSLYGSTGIQQVVIAAQFGEYADHSGIAAQSFLAMGPIAPTLALGSGGGGGVGGLCGGYQPLGRVIPASLSTAHAAGNQLLVSLQYVLDSGGRCQVECKAYGAIRVTPSSPPQSPFALSILSDTGQDGTGAAASGVPVHIEADGVYHPFALSVPSGKALDDATYYAYLYVSGADATIDLDYDLQVWLYSGGVSA